MDFLLNIITFVLGSYLALTNSLALEISSLLPHTETPASSSELIGAHTPELAHANKSGSQYSIPDILIKNAAYQKASLVESIDPATAPATALEAIVNIYCTYRTDTYIKTTNGTGFFIDTDGVILTNAHVAQFLLLEGLEGEAACVIRNGNPAMAMYEAELLYISPLWISEHAKLINDEAPKGTGERDYALLYVTSGIDNKPMPASFAALPFDVVHLSTDIVDTEIFATGYPAESSMADGGKSPLVPKQATTTIGELMTFGSNLVDIFTIRGSAIGEHGSSGGPVVNSDGNAMGIISTRGDDAQFGDGSLRAISISYIDRSITQETSNSLAQNLGGNLPYRASIFKKTIVPFLQQVLGDEL